jgi:hypothetical protein
MKRGCEGGEAEGGGFGIKDIKPYKDRSPMTSLYIIYKIIAIAMAPASRWIIGCETPGKPIEDSALNITIRFRIAINLLSRALGSTRAKGFIGIRNLE